MFLFPRNMGESLWLDVNAMKQVIFGVAYHIYKRLLVFRISKKKACVIRPPMFAAPVAGASVLCRWLLEKDVQNSTLNERSYIWISGWTLRGSFSAACVQTRLVKLIRQKKSYNFLLNRSERSLTWNLLEIEWINSCIKRFIGNVNSASEIKILLNKRPQEMHRKKTGSLR